IGGLSQFRYCPAVANGSPAEHFGVPMFRLVRDLHGLRREIQHQLRFAPQLMDSGAIHESKSMGIGIASPGGYTDALRSRCDRAIGMAQIPEIERQLRTARGPRV